MSDKFMSSDEVLHNKTGKRYRIVATNVIECTNGREAFDYVVYTDGTMMFCREQMEFWRKFTPVVS